MQTEIVKNGKNYSYGLKITPRKGRKDKKPFVIPVIDVRDGQAAREAVKQMCSKGANGSKFIREHFSEAGYSYHYNRFKS